jgi:hypothetical protein
LICVMFLECPREMSKILKTTTQWFRFIVKYFSTLILKESNLPRKTKRSQAKGLETKQLTADE